MKRALVALLGSALACLAVVPASFAATPDTVILVLDASSSMAGKNLTNVVSAATAIIDTIPTGAKLGLVTFNSAQVTSLAPTTNVGSVRTALGAVQARGGTRLYDGIIKAIQGAPSPKTTRLIVVTDGYDGASTAGAKEVLAAIDNSGIAVDVVTVAATDRNLATMKTFTDAGNGRVFQSANATELTDAFTRAFQEAAPSPPPSPSPSPSASASPSATPTGIPTKAPGPPTLRQLVLGPFGQAILASVVAFVYGYVLVLVLADRRRKRAMDRAIATYDPVTKALRPVSTEPQVSAFIEVPGRTKRKTRDRIRPVAAFRSRTFPRLAERLEAADLIMQPERFVLLLAAVGFVLALILDMVIGFMPLAVIMSAMAVFFGQRSLLKVLAARFKRAFESDLADFLVLISSGLRSGMSFSQSVDSAVSEGTGPVERQIRRALAEVRVGSTLEAALNRVAERMDSDDLKWAIAAVQIQREVGGNLSKILDTAAATIRARAELKREIRTLSAEGRLSAYVLLAMPIGLFVYMVVSSRDYIQVLWTETIGMVLMAGFVVSVTIGWFWMRKLIAVDV